jgi:hypothetical protein
MTNQEENYEYPSRAFQVEEQEEIIIVAPLSVYEQLDEEEDEIDDLITFYIEDEIFKLPAEEICANHLDQPYTLIKEYV